MNLQKELEPIKDRLLKIIDKLETAYNMLPEIYNEVKNIQEDLNTLEFNVAEEELNASELNNEQGDGQEQIELSLHQQNLNKGAEEIHKEFIEAMNNPKNHK